MSTAFTALKFYVATALGEVTFLRGSDITLPTTTPVFVPPNDNLTDSASAAFRFRSLYVGTSIRNAGNLAIDLSGAGTTLAIGNSGAGVCDVTIDGGLDVAGQITSHDVISCTGTYFMQDGTVFPGRLRSSTISAARTWDFPNASGIVVLDTFAQTLDNKTLGATTVVSSFRGSLNVETVRFTQTGDGQARPEIVSGTNTCGMNVIHGFVDADLEFRAGGATGIIKLIGPSQVGETGGTVALYGGTPRAQPAPIANVAISVAGDFTGLDTTSNAAIASALATLQASHNAILAALRGAAGINAIQT